MNNRKYKVCLPWSLDVDDKVKRLAVVLCDECFYTSKEALQFSKKFISEGEKLAQELKRADFTSTF